MSLLLPEKKQRKPPKSGVTALIDLDILTYSIGFACQKTIYEIKMFEKDGAIASFNSKRDLNHWIDEVCMLDKGSYSVNTHIEPEPISNCLHSVKVFMEGVLEATNAEFYKGYLTGKGNFRDELATIQVYKGNRTATKPYHYQNIRDYLVKYWDAEIVDGAEADDYLSIEQMKWWENTEPQYLSDVYNTTGCTIICSIDKDLRNTPGWHYNWNKDEVPVWVSEEEATYNFMKQLLIGDRVDNIQGIPGIGPKKAEKILEGCDGELSMYLAVEDAYSDYVCTSADGTPDEMYKITDEMLLENARLLWMVRELDENNQPVMWRPPE